MSRSITSVNSVFMLGINGLYTVPQQLQGFAADDISDFEAVTSSEISMGLDSKMSAGFIPVPIKQGITLQANSDSITLFEAWYSAQIAAREVYFCFGIVQMPAIGRSYALANGVLQDYSPVADAKKTLQPRKFSIIWESVLGAPI